MIFFNVFLLPIRITLTHVYQKNRFCRARPYPDVAEGVEQKLFVHRGRFTSPSYSPTSALADSCNSQTMVAYCMLTTHTATGKLAAMYTSIETVICAGGTAKWKRPQQSCHRQKSDRRRALKRLASYHASTCLLTSILAPVPQLECHLHVFRT